MMIKVAIKREQSQAYLSSAEREQAQRESSFLVKVCGMRDAENIREVEALGIDLMGFIFWPKSGRYVSERPAYLPTNCKRVGVFVDEDIESVKRIADDYVLDFIQLHGHESPEYCAQLKGLKLIKAIRVDRMILRHTRLMRGLWITSFLIRSALAWVGADSSSTGACSQPMMATLRFSSVVASAPMIQSV